MGSGVSKRNRTATSQDKATSTLKESSSNSNTGQPHVQKSPQAQLMFIEDTDTKDEVNVTQAKPTEWHWHIQTRQRYQRNYPEQAESIQTLFDWIKALKNFVDDQLNQLKKFSDGVLTRLNCGVPSQPPSFVGSFLLFYLLPFGFL